MMFFIHCLATPTFNSRAINKRVTDRGSRTEMLSALTLGLGVQVVRIVKCSADPAVVYLSLCVLSCDVLG